MIIADVDDPQWEYVISVDGVDGVTFFDLTGSALWTGNPERVLKFTNDIGVIEALPRDRDTWMVIDDNQWFFALADNVDRVRGRAVRAAGGPLAVGRGLRGDRSAGRPDRRPGHPVLLRD